MIKIPYYSGNIKLVKCMGHVDLDYFIQAHKNSKHKKLINQIKTETDDKKKKALKQKLYSFTPSCYIHKWQKRNLNNIAYFTQLMQLDFDGINDVNMAKEIKQWVFDQPETVCSYFSPSNNVKALIKLYGIESIEDYKAAFNSVKSKYEETGYFDEIVKNPVLPLFLSADENILYRSYFDAEPWKDKSYADNTESIEHHPHLINRNRNYYYDKTIDIFNNRINSISTNGHPQLRTACLILGSRAGSGYISLDECYNLAKALIISNNYLKKDVNNYIKTSVWAIEQGYNNPKKY